MTEFDDDAAVSEVLADDGPEDPVLADGVEGPDEAGLTDFGQQSLLPPATTGEPGVDTALSHLADLDERPVAEHVEAFERVHAALADALTDRPSD